MTIVLLEFCFSRSLCDLSRDHEAAAPTEAKTRTPTANLDFMFIWIALCSLICNCAAISRLRPGRVAQSLSDRKANQ